MNPDRPSREQIEARLTALLLGELPADESELLRWTISQDAELQELHARLLLTVGLVREVVAHPEEASAEKVTPRKLSAERRQKLLAYFKSPRPAPKPLFWLKRIEVRPLATALAMVAIVGVLAAMLLPSLAAAKRKAQNVTMLSATATKAAPEEFFDRNLTVNASSQKPVAAAPVPPAPVVTPAIASTVVPPPTTIVLPQTESAPEAALRDNGTESSKKDGVYSQNAVGYSTISVQHNSAAVPPPTPIPAMNFVNSGQMEPSRAAGAGKTVAARGTLDLHDETRFIVNEVPTADELARARSGDQISNAAKTDYQAGNLSLSDGSVQSGGRDQAVTVMQIQNGDPQQVAQTLQNMFGGNNSRSSTSSQNSAFQQLQQNANGNGTIASIAGGPIIFGGGGGGSSQNSALQQRQLNGVTAMGQTTTSSGIGGGGSGGFGGGGRGGGGSAGNPFAAQLGVSPGGDIQNSGSTGSASISVDPTTHNLVIVADKETQQQIKGAISKLDKPSRQQLIEQPLAANTPAGRVDNFGVAETGVSAAMPSDGVNLAWNAVSNDSSGTGRDGWQTGASGPVTFSGLDETALQKRLPGVSSANAENDVALRDSGQNAGAKEFFRVSGGETSAGKTPALGDSLVAGRWFASAAPAVTPPPPASAAPEFKFELADNFQAAKDQATDPLRRAESAADTLALNSVNFYVNGGLVNNSTLTTAGNLQLAQNTESFGVAKEDGRSTTNNLAKNESKTSDRPIQKTPANAPIPQLEFLTRENAFSTFSMNVSDVSFELAKASLQKAQMPDAAAIRSEEFINAFNYRDPEAVAGQPLAFASELARDPFAHNRDFLRFSVKTAAAGRPADRPLNLVLLLDTSGSMERADRVAIVREALRVLASQLQPQDTVSVVTFARTARLWADGVSGDKAGETLAQVGGITPDGGTNLEEAMRLAYETARRHFLVNGLNRVVLLTDGAVNLGNVDPGALKQTVETQRRQGVALDCFGIGWEDFNDDLLAQLSGNGDGRYAFINSPEEASDEFAAKLAGALQVAAQDVKVQVEFNPQRVAAWRQIGYATHQLTKEQFRDNTVLAAEIAAQEAGNALYTIQTKPDGAGPIATVYVRYRIPGTQDVRERSWAVEYIGAAPALDQSSPAMRLAAVSAEFSEWLAASPFAQEVTPDELLKDLSGVPQAFGADPRPAQLEWMIRQAKSIAGQPVLLSQPSPSVRGGF